MRRDLLLAAVMIGMAGPSFEPQLPKARGCDGCDGCRFLWDNMGADESDRSGHCYMFAEKVENCAKKELA